MPPSGDLRILHWNIHSWRDASGGANLDAVAGLIGETSPDLVSLTEVDEGWGSAGCLRDLAARCGYSWLFMPAFEFGNDHPSGGFGNALLTRLPILGAEQWQLLWPPRVYDGSEPSEQRAVILAKVEVLSVPWWVGVTHLPREDAQARADALHRLVELAQSLRDPWLICGDFNAPAAAWLEEGVSFAVSPAKLTYPAHEPAEPIDYCIASPGFRLDAEVLAVPGSDHLPQLIAASRHSALR